jgi:hypothetical protein
MQPPIRVLLILRISTATLSFPALAQVETPLWTRVEREFESAKSYSDPLYDVPSFTADFRSPTTRITRVRGFWDGGAAWKVTCRLRNPRQSTYSAQWFSPVQGEYSKAENLDPSSILNATSPFEEDAVLILTRR